eukprot:1142741-Pelagomonas_calceolata.AAC.3
MTAGCPTANTFPDVLVHATGSSACYKQIKDDSQEGLSDDAWSALTPTFGYSGMLVYATEKSAWHTDMRGRPLRMDAFEIQCGLFVASTILRAGGTQTL